MDGKGLRDRLELDMQAFVRGYMDGAMRLPDDETCSQCAMQMLFLAENRFGEVARGVVWTGLFGGFHWVGSGEAGEF